jgi:hypothetical protein
MIGHNRSTGGPHRGRTDRRDEARHHYRCGFFFSLSRRRTPGPPPFSSMNSTPEASKARRMAISLAAVNEVPSSATSARLIVFTPRADSRARSAALRELPVASHFRAFSFNRLRRRTPGPSPFSSMNTTPAASKARRTAKSLALLEESLVLGSFCQNPGLDCNTKIIQLLVVTVDDKHGCSARIHRRSPLRCRA